MDLTGVTSAVSSIPVDWIIIGVIFLLVAAEALRSGPSHAAALSLSLPISLVLFDEIPKTMFLGSVVGQFQSSVEQAGLFLLLEIVLFMCLYQMFPSYDHYTSLFSSAIAAFATTVVVLVVWTQLPTLSVVWHFDTRIGAIFGEPYRFFWLFGAYLALAFVES